MSQCFTPYLVEDKLKGKIPVPCGKCYSCVMRRLSGWHFRLSNELKVSRSSHFLTLTYDSDYVPISDSGCLTLQKRDLQLFIKRLRKSLSLLVRGTLLKYYAIGEYGFRFERPHYHAIIFNATPELIYQEWRDVGTGSPLGQVHCGEVTDESIGYVVGYTQKSFYKDWDDENRQPPFACMSKHLGINYLTPAAYKWHKADLDNRMYIPQDGKKLPMPRYFKNLIYSETERKRLAHLSSITAETFLQERADVLYNLYGQRASEIDFEQKKLLYKKLQNKKQKRKL